MVGLKDIVGQDAAVDRLTRTLTGDRVPHALIFAGPRGVGRRTTATAVAATLLCTGSDQAALFSGDAEAPTACGTCKSCTMLAAGTHPDFHPIYKELAAYHEDSNVRNRVMQDLGIDVIRDFLIVPAGRAGAGGSGKVFVVLEAELMNAASQNALLKTLEEPPPGVTIILICSRPDQLLATTRSRCSMIRFGLLPAEFVVERLVADSVDPAEAAYWAALTGGSIGRAKELVDAGLYEIKRDLLDRLAGMGPAGDGELAENLIKTMDVLAKAAVSRSKKADGPELSTNLANRQAAAAVLEVLVSAYRDALSEAGCSDRPRINADQDRQITALAGRFSTGQLCDVIEQLAGFERLLWRNVNPKVVWDNVAITCATAAPATL